MIKRLTNIYILPLKYIPSYFAYVLLKIFRVDLRNSYLEWVNSFHLALLYSNSRSIVESKESITCYCNDNKYNITLRKNPSSDVLVYNHVFGNPKEYETVCNIYKENFKSDNLFIIDAGANVGYASLYFSNQFANYKIISIEPEPSNFNILTKNISDNKLNNNILPYKKALWHCITTLELFTDNKKEWGFSVNEITNNNANKTETITINEILKVENKEVINILKVDIEGAEYEIFLHDDRYTNFILKTQLLAIEIHDRAENYKKIIDNITKLGFTYSESGELTIFVNQNLLKK